MKKTSFTTDFRESLELLLPYVVLMAVMIAALTSLGDWSRFFDKTFPRWLGIMAMMWVVMALYFASARRKGSMLGSSGYADDDDSGIAPTNPANGLPMSGGFDSAGNPVGADFLNND